MIIITIISLLITTVNAIRYSLWYNETVYIFQRGETEALEYPYFEEYPNYYYYEKDICVYDACNCIFGIIWTSKY